MEIQNGSGVCRKLVLSGITAMLAMTAWGDPGMTPLPKPVDATVLSDISHPILVQPPNLRRNPRNSYIRPGSPIAISIDDHDRTLSPEERHRLQEALDQLPTDALAGLPSLYISRGRVTKGFLSPLNGTDLVISLEDRSDHTEGPFAIRQAVVMAVGQYVYQNRLSSREREEWKTLYRGPHLFTQELRTGFSADYAAYALDSRQCFADAVHSALKTGASNEALGRALFIASLFAEPGSPQAGLRYYKTYDNGATDIPWPPKTATRDFIHLQMGPFFFQVKNGQIVGSAYAADSRGIARMSEGVYRLAASYTPFRRPVHIPHATTTRIRAANG